jgi:hypothetical protein
MVEMPFDPSVTLTTSASALTPRRIASRAWVSKRSSYDIDGSLLEPLAGSRTVGPEPPQPHPIPADGLLGLEHSGA